MISFQRISTVDESLYKYMESMITSSFPTEEYRPLEELRLYTDSKPHFHNNIIFHHDTPIGCITYWHFGTFYYVEHFAIDPALRNGGYGRSALEHLYQLLKTPIVLEVEMPENEIAQRRINFYKRQGFVLWDKPYMQPPYRPGNGYLPLLLMVHGDLKCDRDFETVKEQIYREVYNV
ncbi:GNAT family N-acetyltransferase [uncultured Bacteroides sp.]|uniref:GNAT family N-acetyltransferase n=1 Tax=uncultured Bacteroides sp. TaxID=162156 RepID=UPI002616A629|nr:GNAT family N-acetyltransferase [uncultured Bacteroides sp.]